MEVIILVAIGFSFVIGFLGYVIGVDVGHREERDRWEKEAVRRGVGRYKEPECEIVCGGEVVSRLEFRWNLTRKDEEPSRI